MGRSAGPGSPVFFRCTKCRSTLNPDKSKGWRVELTGRTRQRPPRGVLGSRNSWVAREYRCLDCGHVGWSTHNDLAR